ncbi:caspase recruitment domain-containing protein 16 [Hyla sarda]|uniref:caspase recruitment domain-containing protein 16 n=1 Tax=Hyla sarda TaxID=327740 RepID=UPI0024C2E36C|nr:caspase recruitment domain-containing protein 16 [Hyla sarda]
MAGKLEAIRTQLVERCHSALLQGLLDELRLRRVLDALEVEHINENQPQRANKCRTMIDTVIKKGDASCNILLQIIIEKDPALSEHLGIPGAL